MNHERGQQAQNHPHHQPDVRARSGECRSAHGRCGSGDGATRPSRDRIHGQPRLWRHFEGRHTVERFQSHRHIQIYKERHPSLPIKFLRAWRFRCVGRRTIKERRPKIVIAYDPNAMWAAGPLWKRRKGPRVLWHFHELFLPKARDGTASGSRKGLGRQRYLGMGNPWLRC